MTISIKSQHQENVAFIILDEQLDNHQVNLDESPNTDRLSQILERVTLTPDLLKSCRQPATNRPYTKIRLLKSNQFDCDILIWNYLNSCAIHDHGDESEGVVKVLSGLLVNRTYKRNEEKLLLKDKENIHSQDDIISMPKGTIHSMVSIGKQQLVTLHCYYPPIQRMRVYDPPIMLFAPLKLIVVLGFPTISDR